MATEEKEEEGNEIKKMCAFLRYILGIEPSMIAASLKQAEDHSINISDPQISSTLPSSPGRSSGLFFDATQ